MVISGELIKRIVFSRSVYATSSKRFFGGRLFHSWS